jgi:hypothetical protein
LMAADRRAPRLRVRSERVEADVARSSISKAMEVVSEQSLVKNSCCCCCGSMCIYAMCVCVCVCLCLVRLFV